MTRNTPLKEKWDRKVFSAWLRRFDFPEVTTFINVAVLWCRSEAFRGGVRNVMIYGRTPNGGWSPEGCWRFDLFDDLKH